MFGTSLAGRMVVSNLRQLALGSPLLRHDVRESVNREEGLYLLKGFWKRSVHNFCSLWL